MQRTGTTSGSCVYTERCVASGQRENFCLCPQEKRMSTFQGQCGYCDPSGCWPAPVFPGQTEQFGGSDSKEFRATATVYGHALTIQRSGGVPRFTSATDYLRYKKGLIAAGSAGGYRPYRAPPAPIADMIAAGCPCAEVCPVSTTNDNTPGAGPIDVDDSEFQAYIDFLYGTSTPIPSPPSGYLYDYYIALFYPPYCNSTLESVRVIGEDGSTISSQITNLGPSPTIGLGGVFIIYPSSDAVSRITFTASNSCSSSTGDVDLFGLGRSVASRGVDPKWWSRWTSKKN